MMAVLATLRLQDLENIERLSAYLATIYGLSEEDCLAALKECDAQLLAMKAMFESTASPASPDGVTKTSPRKRKVNHVCIYCRRSHMTCDLERPCTQCIKRSIGHLCRYEPPVPLKKHRVGSNFQDMHNLHPAYMFNTSEASKEHNLLFLGNDFLSNALQVPSSIPQVSQNAQQPQGLGGPLLSEAMIDQTPSHAIPMFGDERYSRSQFTMADDFAAWLFNDSNFDLVASSMGYQGYQGYQVDNVFQQSGSNSSQITEDQSKHHARSNI